MLSVVLFVVLAVISGILILLWMERAFAHYSSTRQYGNIGAIGPAFLALVIWVVSWVPIAAFIEWLGFV